MSSSGYVSTLVALLCLVRPIAVQAQSQLCSSGSPGLSKWESIHQTLHTYPLAIDAKDSTLFPCVFAQDAVANYTEPISNLVGLDTIRDTLLASVGSLVTQHQLGTTKIEIEYSGKAAISTTYFVATLFSTAAETRGSYTVLHGLYDDHLIETDNGWRIIRRDLIFMTPNIGNLTLG